MSGTRASQTTLRACRSLTGEAKRSTAKPKPKNRCSVPEPNLEAWNPLKLLRTRVCFAVQTCCVFSTSPALSWYKPAVPGTRTASLVLGERCLCTRTSNPYKDEWVRVGGQDGTLSPWS
eukprot:2729714-Rhodomonas_salina.4